MTDKTDLKKILNMPWYLLEQPWCHSSNSGTTILAGNPDPHVATVIADTEMLMDGVDGEFTMERARGIAQHIVDLHNEKLESQPH